ncbi:hypothetical protein JMJ55_01865 [Belnapia sp. T6]|uniref:Uncharacterized protein n=1 Tax=Belnapia mucosa TaxID=2804532 RepID=A0ABS1UX47_9PROT|nr:hypothetical protein [Belnapia mucosa]MBL6454049.1 hypothetical protein [Belnapia mucosa]
MTVSFRNVSERVSLRWASPSTALSRLPAKARSRTASRLRCCMQAGTTFSHEELNRRGSPVAALVPVAQATSYQEVLAAGPDLGMLSAAELVALTGVIEVLP